MEIMLEKGFIEVKSPQFLIAKGNEAPEYNLIIREKSCSDIKEVTKKEFQKLYRQPARVKVVFQDTEVHNILSVSW